MNVTILYAYPHDGGYNHAVLEAVQAGFSSRADSMKETVHVTTLDLYKEGFDPILRFDAEHRAVTSSTTLPPKSTAHSSQTATSSSSSFPSGGLVCRLF